MRYQDYGLRGLDWKFFLTIFASFLEHVTAVTVSVKDKLNLSIGVAVGSSIVGLVHCLLQQKVN